MEGAHHLNVTLFISSVANLSFLGDERDIILSDGCSIIWTISKISWISLNLMREIRNQSLH